MAVISVLTAIFGDGVRYVYDRIAYDWTPAAVVHAIEIQNQRIAPGEPLGYRMNYSKRADCHPPMGSSEIRFMLHDYNLERSPNNVPWARWISYSRESRAGPGERVIMPDFSVIPLPMLDAGKYALQWQATYVCANSKDQQVIDGPLLPFEVVAKN